ncbi:hypothetical protein CPB83DRAFT_862709 [Crepidotus variabilis]|uniref:DUF6533 domain-containing protein n=1 Tax=Crepidotus variabilis TaxID=179855 RepID=A0A9P6E6S5_9AGAR|nr:hypothetical protein CPB83DRAFT_862709 [Crepidotus variabilis]
MANAEIEQQQFLDTCFSAASFGLLYYDYFLTLHLEHARFWSNKRRLTWVSLFFYLNRYIALLGHIPIIFRDFSTSTNPHRLKTCIHLLTYHSFLILVVQIVVGVLLVTRTYALYDQQRWVLAVLLSCGFAAIAWALCSILKGHDTPYTTDQLPVRGCSLPLSETIASRSASAWIAMLCFDLLIFLMTLYKSVSNILKGSRFSSFFLVLLRDGTIYFGIMVVTCSITIYNLQHGHDYEKKGILVTFTNVASSTMCSRLMLNMRDPSISGRLPIRLRNKLTGGTVGGHHATLTSIIDGSVFTERSKVGDCSIPRDSSLELKGHEMELSNEKVIMLDEDDIQTVHRCQTETTLDYCV